MSASIDEARGARLLFSEELRLGLVGPKQLEDARVRRAVKARRAPPAPVRALQRVRMKRGRLTYDHDTAKRFVTARRAVLGDAAAAPPRLLVRVDEFPHYLAADQPRRYGTDMFRRFHDLLSEHAMRYLIAVVPRVPTDPLNPSERRYRRIDDAELEMLSTLAKDGVEFALHGLNHRTRDSRPRHHSELSGLAPDDLEELLETGLAELAEIGIRPRVFVPPYNRFDRSQYQALARRFAVVCGGPENVLQHGFSDTPRWRGDAVWLPCYPPLYEHAVAVRPAVERLANEQTGLWTPTVLHWGWEADAGWTALERFARDAGHLAASWQSFLDAVEESRREQ